MTTHIASNDFEIHSVPREQFMFASPRTLIVQFVNTEDKVTKLIFTNVIGLKMIHEKYVQYSSLKAENGFPKRLLELEPAQWADHYTTIEASEIVRLSMSEHPTLRHFVLRSEIGFLRSLLEPVMDFRNRRKGKSV